MKVNKDLKTESLLLGIIFVFVFLHCSTSEVQKTYS